MRLTGATALLPLLLASACFADLRFQPLVLDQLGYTYSQPRGINDEGTVVGVVQNSAQFNDTYFARAVRWDASSGAGSLLGVPAGFVGSAAEDINNEGVIVGSVANLSFSTRAMRYNSGNFFLPSTSAGRLLSINDAGDAVGAINDAPILLRGSSLTDLNGSSTTAGAAWSIASNGQIVGYHRTSSGYSFLYQAHRFAPEQTPVALSAPTADSHALGVNAQGILVGRVTVPAMPVAGALPVTFNGSGGYTTLPGGFTGAGNDSGTALAINDQGWIIGVKAAPTAGIGDLVGTLWKDGQYHEVTSLLPQQHAGLLKILGIYAINNRGQLAAVARQDLDGDPLTTPARYVAVRLDPIRSPGDTNYDGVVDFEDLLTLAQHYGQSGNGNVFYETGDFNYDWTVDFDDLLTLAQHYHSADAFDADWALARSLVPEPSAVALLAVAALTYRRERH